MHFRKRTFLHIIIAAIVVSMILGTSLRTEVKAAGESGSTYWLTVGQVNEEVYYLQAMLKYLGYYAYDLDGDFGKRTEESVLRFQQDYGLYADGIAGDQTVGKLWSLTGWAGIQAAIPAQNTSTQNTSSQNTTTQNTSAQQGNATAQQGNASAQTSSSWADYNNLRYGVPSSAAVTYLQKVLKAWGYYAEVIDGDFGAYTDAAVKKFQADHGLYVDGIVGLVTWKALLNWTGANGNTSGSQSSGNASGSQSSGNASGSQSTTTTDQTKPSSGQSGSTSQTGTTSQAGTSTQTISTVNVRTLQNGMTGEDVALLQKCLQLWGYLDSIIDGIFGNYTEAAVIRFQQAKGLYVDGIVGQQTWAALYNVSTGTSASQATNRPAAGTVLTSAQVQAAGVDSFFYVEEISDATFARMWGRSYQPNSVISRYDLRYIRCLHKDINGTIKVGELVMHKGVANTVCKILRVLYDQSYPIQSMVLVDEFGGDDELSIMYNNTSAFNYRMVDDTSELSYHAYGLAIDINPYYNVYYIPSLDYVFPEAGRQYLDRSASFPYKLEPGDLCYNLFTMAGFSWGGTFSYNPDYQHFYYTGR